MGKKSKKKGKAGDTKASRKERLQERREQQLDALDRDSDEDYDDDEANENEPPAPLHREYFVGDRVWFVVKDYWDACNSNSYRGIVKCVHLSSVDILSMQSMIDGDSTTLINVPLDDYDLYPDFCDLTLRFNVGERVICKCDTGWLPMTVAYLWPIGEINDPPQTTNDVVPRYKCRDPRNRHEFVAAPEDNDRYIMKHPSIYRCELYDRVIFNARLAKTTTKVAIQYLNKSSWIEATVTARDVTGLEYYYISYECSFDIAGKQHLCHITKDDDEHIAHANASPRKRLFDAIEQDCSRTHLIYLTTTYSIDVFTFRDLVIAKALDCASYQTLSWLQYDCKIDVLHYKDDGGNNILHRIASSSNAAHFIRTAGRLRNLNPMPEWYLNIFIYEVVENPNPNGANKLLHMINAPNNNAESWLQILVRRGDVYAFDAALSPNGGLGLEFASNYRFDDEELNSLAKTVKDSNDVIMQVVLDSFIMFRTLYLQCSDICYSSFSKSEEELLQSESMVVFQGTEARHHAKLLARFLLDWEGNIDLKVRQGLVRNSLSKLFSLLCDVNDVVFRLFSNDTYILCSNKDQNEYIQPELSPVIGEFSSECLEVDLAMACVIGKDGKYSDCERDTYYFSQLKQHALSSGDDGSSWLSRMKKLTEKDHSYYSMDFMKNKIKLLEDDADLQGRLQILEYILTRQSTIKLNVLEAIKHRQCGVLRFMVDKSLVQIDSNVSSNQFFKTGASKLQFLDRGRIPSSMLTKCFLCFAAVEYDDLQSLQWIYESFGMETELCDGWNLLHFSAFMGRIEIVAWLYTQPVFWQSLVVQACQRKPFQGAFAVHIAAMQGHIILVELLLDMKVSQEDDQGNTPESYAKKSQHTFAQDWALRIEKQQEKPRARERIIQKLFQLTKSSQTTPDSLKTFIITSKCLDKETWNDCVYYEKGPMGYSCGDILHVCCSTFPDKSFVLWLCARLYFLDNEHYGFWRNDLAIKTQPLTRDYLFSVAKDKGYNDIVRYLSKQLFVDIRCADPMTYNFVLVSALGIGDSLLETRASILRVLILLQIAKKTNDEFRNLVKRGGSSTYVDEILRISSTVKKCLVDEGYAQEGYNDRGSAISGVVKLIDMSTYVIQDYKRDEHSLFKQLAFRKISGGSNHVHIILATEGFAELLEYCLRNLQGWTVDMELDVVRIAAFYGHSSILELFLTGEGLLSTVSCRIRAALFGFGEAGRSRDMIQLLDSYGDQDAFVKEERLSSDANFDSRKAYADKSLACAVINGYISFLSDRDMTTLLILVDRFDYTHDDIINAAATFLSTTIFGMEMMGRFVDVMQSAFESLNLEPISHHKQMQGLCTEIVIFFDRRMWCSSDNETEESMTVQSRTLQWLSQIADQGIDIQNLAPDSYYRHDPGKTGFLPKYLELEKRQLNKWSRFDIIVNGGSLQEIQDVVEQGRLSIHARYRGGLMLTHLSSAYDRDDLLQWLIVTKGMKLDSQDGQCRNVLEVAMAAQAKSTIKWIVEHKAGRMIAKFMHQHQRHILAVRKQQRLARAATFIQRRYRGNSIRKIYRGSLLLRLEASPRFQVVWGALAYSIHDFSQTTSGWSSIRERISDIIRIHDDDGNFDDTDEHLSKALEEAMLMDESDNKNDGEVFVKGQRSLDVIEGQTTDTASWLSFQMTR